MTDHRSDPRYKGALVAAARALGEHEPVYGSGFDTSPDCKCGDDRFFTGQHVAQVVLDAALESGHLISAAKLEKLSNEIVLARNQHTLGFEDQAWCRLSKASRAATRED